MDDIGSRLALPSLVAPPAPASRSPKPRRVEPRNRLWRGIQTVAVFTGLDPRVDALALRLALRRLHHLDPGARAVCRLTGDPERWVSITADELDGWLDRLVIEDPQLRPDDLESVTEQLLRQPCDERPFVVTVGDGVIGWQINHVFADANYGLRHVMTGLLRAAARGEAPRELLAPAEPAGRRPLLAASWRTLVKQPRLETWRTAVDRLVAGHAAPEQVPYLGDGVPDLSVVSRLGRPATMVVLREWAREYAPDLPVTVLIVAAARIALERHGVVGPATDSVVMYDLRRYLPRAVDVEGNFSAALRLTDSSCRTPRQIAEQMARNVELGLPLVSLLAATTGEALSPIRSAMARNGGRPEHAGPVGLTHLGSMSPLRKLPWNSRVDTHRVVMSAAPSAVDGITICTNEWGRALHVACSFDGRLVPRDKMVAAATDLVEEPWRLLAEGATW